MSKTVSITGTSSGFGKLAAITLSKEGYNVIAGMRGTAGINAEIAKELAAITNIEVIEIEVTSNKSVNLAIRQTISKYGQMMCQLIFNSSVKSPVFVVSQRVLIKKLQIFQFEAF